MDWATWRSPLARWSSPRRRAAGWDWLLVLISSSSLARSISLGPSAGRPTQATSRASQPARLPRTAGRRRSARAMFQMRPRTGGGGPVPQAPPPTASPRHRVAGAVILQGWAEPRRPRRRAIPLPGLTAEAEPGSARLGLRWRFRAWLTSFGPSGLHRRTLFAPGLHRRTLFAPGLCSCGARRRPGTPKPVVRTHNVPCIHENFFWKSEAGFSSINHPLGLSDKPRPRPRMSGS
jgi:hypothetical protein